MLFVFYRKKIDNAQDVCYNQKGIIIMNDLNKNHKEIFFISIPLSFIFVGKAKLEVNDDKIERLDYFDKIDVIQKKDKSKKISKKENERQMKTIDEIMIKIEKLPRDKQMELLNYIKGSELLADNNISSEIDKLSDENISFLQDRFEDVLFPDFDEKDDVYGYSRKKRK